METIDMKTATFEINGRSHDLLEKIRVIDAAKNAGIDIPSICNKSAAPGESSCAPGSCRLCQVEINGQLSTACEQWVRPNIVIETNTLKARKAQKFALEMICADHDGQCLDCRASQTCKLLEMSDQIGTNHGHNGYFPDELGRAKDKGLIKLERDLFKELPEFTSLSIEFDSSLCIKCGRCASVCPTDAMGSIGRGVDKRMGPPPMMEFDALCVNCGQCIKVCPTGALAEVSHIEMVEKALNDPSKRVVFQIAPAVRVALGEAFGLPPGKRITGKLYAALRKLGVSLKSSEIMVESNGNGSANKRALKTNVLVTDTNVTADLTIMEEGTELVGRIQEGGKLPIITSCCPAWIKYMETYYPSLIDHASTAKSPQQMMGALIKTYGAATWDVDPENIVSVSVMPCTAKKFEAQRPEMEASGRRDVDFVLTTRELARLLKSKGLNPASFGEEKADYPFEEYSGAATIFGNTGGVMEAAIRTVHKLVTGEELEGIEFKPARGMESLKVATVNLKGLEVKVAVLHNLNSDPVAEILDDLLINGNKQNLGAIEIMACPGGCIGGGGQPIEFNWETKAKRVEGLNKDDADQRLRRSHESPVIERIYADYLEKPNSEKAHQLCHTEYEDRSFALKKEPIGDY